MYFNISLLKKYQVFYKSEQKNKSESNYLFRLIQVTSFLIMEITQFQIKVFVTVFFAAFETSSGCNQVAAQEDEYSSGGGIKHKKDMTSHGRYSCCCLAMVINYQALGDVLSTCLISAIAVVSCVLSIIYVRIIFSKH